MIRISAIEIHFFSSISLPQEALSDTLLHSQGGAYSLSLLALLCKYRFIGVVILVNVHLFTLIPGWLWPCFL